jgi:serine/threonine protein kinase
LNKAWKAIRELLFSYELFPVQSIAENIHGALYSCRKDKEFIYSLEQQIIAEISGEYSLSYHWNKNHPVDPIQVKLGFTDFDATAGANEIENSALSLSDTCSRVWAFLCIFVNFNDESDHYQNSVERVLENLSHEEIGYLSGMAIPIDIFKNTGSPRLDKDLLTIQNYANVHCKKIIFQKYCCFAGMYDFAPKSTSSIVLHHSRNNDSIMIHATKLEFLFKKPREETAKSQWMFDPTSELHRRSDFEIIESPVVFKFMTKRLDFEREVKWRKELNDVYSSSHVLQILTTFEPTCIDGEVDEKYAVDRMHQRFKELPLRKRAADRTEFLDITNYPYAVVFPYACGGSLQDTLIKDKLTLVDIKKVASQMGKALNEFHERGLIHGSFTASHILSFLDRKEGILERSFKLSGLSSVTPSGFVGGANIKLGAITPGGRCLFDNSKLPPEMYTKLDRLQLEQYDIYWKVVMKLKNVEIPEEMIKPLIDPITQEVYVKKCYCLLDESTMQALPHLPYDLVELETSLDIWAFGIVLFQMLSGGESLLTSKKTGEIASAEILAKWDIHVAHSFVSQNIADVAAQDLLIHILSPLHIRQSMDMKIVLAHPFFFTSPLPDDINHLLTNAKEERELIAKIKGKQFESNKMTETEFEPTRLGRIGLKTQLRLTNSATEALRECFDPHDKFIKNAPFTLFLLPYQLKRKGNGDYSLGTEIDVDIAQRLGRQILEQCKALWFAVCYSEKLKSGGEEFKQVLSNIFTSRFQEISPIDFGKDILEVLRLKEDQYGDVVTNFVLVVQELIQIDEQTFIDDPLSPVLTLISQYASKIANTFSITNQGYLYLLDEYSCTIAHENDTISQYPHLFREHIREIVYKCLPYIHASVSSILCTEQGPETFSKLLCGESGSVAVHKSWGDSFSGIPTIPIRKRMVTELSLLHEALHSTLIPSDSPIALNGEQELQFFSSLYVHIDSSRTFAGLRPITDETGTMWVTEKSKMLLLQESAFESKPESVYDAFAREEIRNEELVEKDRKITQLEKALRNAQLELEKARAEVEI